MRASHERFDDIVLPDKQSSGAQQRYQATAPKRKNNFARRPPPQHLMDGHPSYDLNPPHVRRVLLFCQGAFKNKY